MPLREFTGTNEPVEDVDRMMRFAIRAGLPTMMADPEEDGLHPVGGDFPHYVGARRGIGDAKVFKVECSGERKPLNPRFDLARHSPDGFEWGYEGSGPAQLALAICADVLEDDRAALEIYQSFKRRVIARIQHRRFTLTGPAVRAAIAQLLEEQSS